MGDGYHKRLPIHHLEGEIAEELVSPEDDRFFAGRAEKKMPNILRNRSPILVDSGGVFIFNCRQGGLWLLVEEEAYRKVEGLLRIKELKDLLGEPDESWFQYAEGLIALWYARKYPFPLSKIREI